MSETATLTVISGPDRGKVFAISEELVHVGHGPLNHVDLADAEVADHQASIVRRNGRFAVYTPLPRGLEVDGAPIPPERWVWLPHRAAIKIGEHTSLQFDAAGRSTGPGPALDERREHRAESSNDGSHRPASPQAVPRKSAGKRSRPKGRQVARFITDHAGEPRVTLGEDGHLPELNLAEGPVRKASHRRDPRSKSVLVYVVVAVSFSLSLAMLFIDMEPSATSDQGKAQARQEIVTFCGEDDKEPELYQRYLRQAQLASSRGDFDTERQAYRKVLRLLNSEDNNRLTGLTGSPEQDERLRQLIAVLLR